jgi:penicillin-binding protein 1B
LRIRLGRGFWTSRFGLALLAGALGVLLAGAGLLTFYYSRFSRLIDERLSGRVFENTSRIFTAPRLVSVGDPGAPPELASYLERAGYAESDMAGALGRFRVEGSAVEIRPGPSSYFGGANALRVEFSGGQVARIESLAGGVPAAAELEPELLTNLFDSSREKRRLVRFESLPRVLVDAVLAAEDKRFFDHPGFDPIRVFGAAWADLRRGEMAQGASTITMQVARSFFFSLERRGWAAWRRKMAETFMALLLEQRFTKEQIFELYANQIYLGNRGSFAIRGFGEAAQAYFARDVRELNLPQAAFLAGIIRAPNRYSAAERRPERAAEARDRVLAQMVENGQVSPEAAEAAKKVPLGLVRGALETSSAPYFVDMVKDHLLDRYAESELVSSSYRIYTTLDAALQRAAVEAVEAGMRDVDKLLARRYEQWRRRGQPVPPAQVALIALDPRTGEIKALVGGRNYGESQLNRALARRQPGSAFKPFVYAAAFENAVSEIEPVLTPTSTVVDEPTTFYFEDKEYTPNNYGEHFRGTVTLRDALTYSLNVATVKVAELTGYGHVAQLARQLGLDPRIQGTPSVALGAYEMTPLEVAAGYTVFANLGTRAEPQFLRRVVSAEGRVLERPLPQSHPVLDRRVAYLVVNVLEDVINRGTGATVRARGFEAPAAGKTGTSRDAWFVGFTSELLCVIWVGFDDNRDLGLSGTASAASVWAQFMKRAVALPGYRNPQPFVPPPGVNLVEIDPETMQMATPQCPARRTEAFIDGTEPHDFCYRHGGRMLTQIPPASWLSRLFGGKKPAEPAAPGDSAEGAAPPGAPSAASAPKAAPRPPAKAQPPAAKTTSKAEPESEKKKGFLQRLFGIFGGGKKKDEAKPGKGS